MTAVLTVARCLLRLASDQIRAEGIACVGWLVLHGERGGLLAMRAVSGGFCLDRPVALGSNAGSWYS